MESSNHFHSRKICLLVLTIFLPFFNSFAQQASSKNLENFVKRADKFQTNNPQEKVYLHFDNTGYYQGDTIWFKAYVVSAENNHATSLSRVLHVELLTPEGEVQEDKMLQIQKNGCDGYFALSKAYRSGFYEVRAYTRAMLNFGEACVFSRTFPIYEAPESEGAYYERQISEKVSRAENKREKSKDADKINMSFYPEGGNAVMGVPSKVGFKVTDKDGRNISAYGRVLNENNDEVARFNTTTQGMGCFVLIPDQLKYAVKLSYGGRDYDFTLDKISEQGYSIDVNNLMKDRMLVQFQKSQGLPTDTVGFVLSCRGKQLQFEELILNDAPHPMYIQKKDLPLGVIQLTLFDKNGNILVERLVFNSTRQDYGHIQAGKTAESYEPLSLVEMDFAVSDASGEPLKTSFSLAIRDKGTEVQTSYADNVLTDLLLSSELKGYIENPMQYFVNEDVETLSKLDLLMMVQGWRRYNWQAMAGAIPFEVKHYAEEGLPIMGKVLNGSGKKVREKAELTFWLTHDGKKVFGSTPVDEDGGFSFVLSEDDPLFGECLLSLQVTEGGKRKTSLITLDRWFSPQPKVYTVYDTQVKEEFAIAEENIPQRSIDQVQLLAGITVQQKKRRSVPFGPDITYDVKRDINKVADQGTWYPATIEEYLLDRGFGMFVDMMTCQMGLAPETVEGAEGFVDDAADAVTAAAADAANAAAMAQSTAMDDMPDLMEGIDNYIDSICFLGRPVFIGICPESVPDSINRWEDMLTEDIEKVSKIDVYYTTDYPWLQAARAGSVRFRTHMDGNAVFVRLSMYEGAALSNGYTKGVRYTPYYGYAQSADFYQVDNREKQLKGGVDYRRTLYWNPNVQTDKDGKAQVRFYNNSTCLRMTVSAEGVSAEGEPILLVE